MVVGTEVDQTAVPVPKDVPEIPVLVEVTFQEG